MRLLPIGKMNTRKSAELGKFKTKYVYMRKINIMSMRAV